MTHEERYRRACHIADDAILKLAIDRLPAFADWPGPPEKWFEIFFNLLGRAEARDLQKSTDK